MPTEKQVFLAADAVLASGARVSLRSVMARLVEQGRGGSFRDVGPHVLEWKAQRGYRPRLVAEGLPERLQARLATFATEVWAAAQAEAMAATLVDRENMAERARAGDAVLEEALARLDAVEAEAGRLRAQVERLEDHSGRARAAEFWDRVMREVYETLPAIGEMTAAEILPRLRPATVRGAVEHREPLTAGTLRKKMAGRVQQGWYFAGGEKGRFSRGTFPTLGRAKAPAPME